MPAKLLSEDEARQYLDDSDTGRLATCDMQGQPYIVPLNYIFFRDSIYFHCAHEGKKLDNIKANDKVCFEVSQTDKTVFGDKPCNCATRYTSVLVVGKASVVLDVQEKMAVLNALTVKFAKGRPFPFIDENMAGVCTVVRIDISEIFGKKNVDPQ